MIIILNAPAGTKREHFSFPPLEAPAKKPNKIKHLAGKKILNKLTTILLSH
tara:strand:+ start:497 stop:649 length:153 start_codon:yes stop_codon:yes gene_type:complete